jgi:hypothetical protein
VTQTWVFFLPDFNSLLFKLDSWKGSIQMTQAFYAHLNNKTIKKEEKKKRQHPSLGIVQNANPQSPCQSCQIRNPGHEAAPI